MYTGRGLIQSVDEMLWDLASRHARMPLYQLLGGARDRIPAYRNIGGRNTDEYVQSAMQAREEGFKGAKDHSYAGVQGNAERFRALREGDGGRLHPYPRSGRVLHVRRGNQDRP